MVVRQGPVRFEIVCTGNICRSPFVHMVLADALDRIAPGQFEVASSGTHALAGTPPDNGTRAMVRERGLSLTGYRAAQITPMRLEQADVILVMDKDQRQHVIDEHAGAARRTFLLKEAARLIEALDREQPWERRLARVADRSTRGLWRDVVGVLAGERERLRAADDRDLLADPFRQGHEAFVLMAEEASAAVATLVALQSRLVGQAARPA